MAFQGRRETIERQQTSFQFAVRVPTQKPRCKQNPAWQHKVYIVCLWRASALQTHGLPFLRGNPLLQGRVAGWWLAIPVASLILELTPLPVHTLTAMSSCYVKNVTTRRYGSSYFHLSICKDSSHRLWVQVVAPKLERLNIAPQKLTFLPCGCLAYSLNNLSFFIL